VLEMVEAGARRVTVSDDKPFTPLGTAEVLWLDRSQSKFCCRRRKCMSTTRKLVTRVGFIVL
jgi:hypothetical protein